MEPPSEEDITQAMENLPQWEHKAGMLVSRIEFDDFPHAMDFVNLIADIAEQRGHHPGIIIDYNIVTFELFTHDADGITDKDVALAHAIDDALEEFSYGPGYGAFD